MKILMLMRHAKSSWSDEYADDFDRPLNKRGRHDAPRIGALLAEQALTPDRIVSSSARRAADTAAAVGAASGFEGELELTRELYLAPPDNYLDIGALQNDNCQRMMMIGHNPGIEALVRQLSGEPRTMSTAAFAQFDVDIDHWSQLQEEFACELRAFWRPADLDF